jgi:hypothetical protein
MKHLLIMKSVIRENIPIVKTVKIQQLQPFKIVKRVKKRVAQKPFKRVFGD